MDEKPKVCPYPTASREMRKALGYEDDDQKTGHEQPKDTWLTENVYTSDGHRARIRSPAFYWGAFWSIVLGIVLIYEEMMIGGFIILTVAPFLLLYPLIRFLFGGKDSIGAAITTAVVEELLKNEIRNSKKKKRK